MSKDTIKLGKTAMHLMDPAGEKSCQFAFSDTPGEKGTFRMVGYSGGVIKNHWYWDDLIIDLEGLSFDKEKYPILRDHSTDMEIGFSTKPQITNDGLLFTDQEVTFLDNEEADKFIANAKKGFPYQASIFAIPSVIERFSEGESIMVNGNKLEGPGTVWRKAALQECSICVFGYDKNTSAEAFSKGGEEVELEVEQLGNCTGSSTSNNNGGSQMDMNKFKQDHPELLAQIVAQTTADVEAKFQETSDAAAQKFQADADVQAGEIARLQEENAKLAKDGEGLVERMLKLEKKDALRTEAAMAAQADAIVTTKLSASGLPDRLHSKVRAQLSHEKFSKEGVLDVTGFGAAADAEIADWEDTLNTGATQFGIPAVVRTVNGGDENQLSAAADDVVDRMLAASGQAATK